MLRQSPRRTPALLAANRANALKSTGPRTKGGKQLVTGNLKRYLERLLGVPEAVFLDQEPGAAIHLYYDLIAPYEPAPPLLAMHFRELARLQLELQALEGIRDALMWQRVEQTQLEMRRWRREMDRELGATVGNIFDEGLCRLPDSLGKFSEQHDCLIALKYKLGQREFADLDPSLRRLYGDRLAPDHERGQMICGYARRLMELQDGQPPDENDINSLSILLEAERRDVVEAWEIAFDDKKMTQAATRARLAPTREDHWMNRQVDRLRQAIDRKMRFTPILLRALGLAYRHRPRLAKKHRKTSKTSTHKAGISRRIKQMT
jgi:hypothetical protein